MKKLIITSGNWTANGNFSGYDTQVGRVHLYGAQMKGLGYEKDAVVSFPLFGIGAERSFNQLDDDGQPTGEQFSRWQANGLFKERKQLVEALAADTMVDLEVRKYVKAEATSAGLTEEEISELAAALV